MAGKADLVNGIVDRSENDLQDIPGIDGWKGGALVDRAAAPLPGGGLDLDPFGGAG